jgi:hypothetical protein
MSASEGSPYSFDPRLPYYSQGGPSTPTPGLCHPYSYHGYSLPQMSSWGYGTGPHHHAALSQNPGNVAVQVINNPTPPPSLQFRNTFAPQETPSRAPLAPIPLSQPSLAPVATTTSRKRASQAGTTSLRCVSLIYFFRSNY